MRIMILMLFAILFSCYTLQAYAAAGCGSNWLGNDAVGYDPDFNYAARQRTLSSQSAIDLDNPASKPRLAPDEQPKSRGSSSGPNMSMPDPSPKPLPQENPASNNSSIQSAGNLTLARESFQTWDVSGKWSFKLEGPTRDSINLILIQSNQSIMGSGTLTDKGENIQLIASGSLKENELKMIVKTVVAEYINKIDKRYTFNLFLANATLSGSYELSNAEGILGRGNATATRPAL